MVGRVATGVPILKSMVQVDWGKQKVISNSPALNNNVNYADSWSNQNNNNKIS